MSKTNKTFTNPLTNYDSIADAYAEQVDVKPIHTFYERPATWSLLPKHLNGLNVLDVGCGSGWYAEKLIENGALVTAIDASTRMVELTQRRIKNQARVIQADLEQPLTFLEDESFDIILAPLVIHYVKDLKKLMGEFSRVLKSRGLLIFSTGQPAANYWLFKLDNYYRAQIINDYWPTLKANIQFYHHPLEQYTEALFEAGFVIERLREPQPEEGMKQDLEMYELISNKPWFLFIRAVKVVPSSALCAPSPTRGEGFIQQRR